MSPSWCSRSRQAWPARICPVKIFAHAGKIFAASLPGVAEEGDGAGVSAEVGAHRGEDHEQRGLVSRAQAQGRLRAYHGDGDGDDDDTNYDDDDDDDDDLRTDHGGPDVEGGVGGPRHPVLVHQDQPAGGRSQVFRYGYYLGYSTGSTEASSSSPSDALQQMVRAEGGETGPGDGNNDGSQ